MDRFLLPAPLPALVALAFLLGTLGAAHRLKRWCNQDDPWVFAAAWLTVLGVLAMTLQVVALMGVGLVWTCRALGLGFCMSGLLVAGFNVRHVRLALRRATGVLGWPVVTLLGFLTFGALGPATDADSLAYHLPVPMLWLQSGMVVAQPELLFARLTGVAENLVMLGLALGTDCLSAALQAGALGILAWCVASAGPNGRLAALALASSPTWLFLVPTQKPQALPALAACTALAILLRRGARSFSHDVVVAAWCAAFAVACKLSFAADAGVAVALLVWLVVQKRVSIPTAGMATAVFVAGVAPWLLRNALLYGDPVTPLLERFRSHPDPTVLAFVDYLRSYVRPTNTAEWLQWLASVVIPPSPGNVPLSLGLGVLALGPAVWRRSQAGFAGMASIAVSLLLGQVMARYFVVPMALGLMWLADAPPLPSWVQWGVRAQGAAMGVAALAVALLLGTGALSPSLRRATLVRSANGFELADATNTVVPHDALILTDSRSTAHFMARAVCVVTPGAVAGTSVWAGVQELAPKYAQVFAVVMEGGVSPVGALLQPCLGPPVMELDTSNVARNPFNHAPGPRYGIHKLRRDTPGCAALLGVPPPSATR